MIKECCICGGEVETKKILPFRDLIGTGVEIWNMHIGICPKCGFIFQQTPLTAEQLENRYKNMSKYEYDAEDFARDLPSSYKTSYIHYRNFIDDQLVTHGGGV